MREDIVMTFHRLAIVVLTLGLSTGVSGRADVGDPQIRTDHPWYPGELACSTFERLFATQATRYRPLASCCDIQAVSDAARWGA